MRQRDAPLTLGEHFARRYEHTIEVGDEVRLGPVTLIARELGDDGVARVGLKIARGSAIMRRTWLGTRMLRLFGRH